MNKYMNNGNVFFAFGTGSVSTEETVSKRYIGVAKVNVLKVNPTKSELEEIYNRSIENDLEYLSEQEIDGTKIPTVRIDFIIKTVDNPDVNLTTKVSYFLRKQYRYNGEKTKVQVIDKYGRTAWVTQEQAANKEIPMYKNGPAQLDSDYRPCYVGEEDLTNFIKVYLNIPNVMKYVNNTWVQVDNPSDSEARLDNIEKYFTNDFSELKNILSYQPDNKIKVLLGVRNADNGSQYQTVFNQMVLRNNVSNYSRLETLVNERKSAGAYATTEFGIYDVTEYVVKSTNFAETSTSDSADNWFNN